MLRNCYDATKTLHNNFKPVLITINDIYEFTVSYFCVFCAFINFTVFNFIFFLLKKGEVIIANAQIFFYIKIYINKLQIAGFFLILILIFLTIFCLNRRWKEIWKKYLMLFIKKYDYKYLNSYENKNMSWFCFCFFFLF